MGTEEIEDDLEFLNLEHEDLLRRAMFRKLRGPGYCRVCDGVGRMTKIFCKPHRIRYSATPHACTKCGGTGTTRNPPYA